MDRLTPLADAFLEAEDVDDHAALAIGSFAIFDGPAPDFEEVVRVIGGRVPLIPRYRQRVRRVPFGLAAPAWVDAPDFDLRHHVRHAALPAPGGPAEIGELMSRVMSLRMDRSRPLWEYWMCEGLPGGRWALLSKVHHCLVDGVSGSDLYHLVLDPSPVPRPSAPDAWTPADPVSALRFTAGGARELLSSPVQAAAGLGRALRTPRQLARTALRSTTGLLTLAGALRPVHTSSLGGRLDGVRRYSWTTVSLADSRPVRRGLGVTVNDLALSSVTGGLRALLLSRGETPDRHAVRSLVPVSTRAAGDESTPDNQVTLMLPYLPVEVADPRERLLEVRRRIQHLREQHEPEAGQNMTTLSAYGPFPAVSWGLRLGLRFPQHQITAVTTNVPGPRQPLYALGRELREILPYVPIADRVRIGVAIFSYRDSLTFGITSDHDTTADIEVLTDAIAASWTELLDVVPASG